MENGMLEYRQRRKHFRLGKDYTRVIQLSNKQLLITIPREISRWKHIEKGTVVKWSDGGENRIIIESVKI
jgi:hypothetical protein